VPVLGTGTQGCPGRGWPQGMPVWLKKAAQDTSPTRPWGIPARNWPQDTPRLPGTPRPGTSTVRAPETGTSSGHQRPGLPRQDLTPGNHRASWDRVESWIRAPPQGTPEQALALGHQGTAGQPGCALALEHPRTPWARDQPLGTPVHLSQQPALRHPTASTVPQRQGPAPRMP